MKTLLFALLVAALSQAAPEKIPIHLRTAPMAGGFTDPSQARQDSLKDLQKALKKSKVVRLVEREADARVLIEILDRTTSQEYNTPMGHTTKHVAVRLTAGTFTSDFTGSAVLYSVAAKRVAEQIDQWVKANQGALGK